MPHAALRRIVRSLLPNAVLNRRYRRYFFETSPASGFMQYGKFDSLDEAQALLRSEGQDGHYAMDQAQWSVERTSRYFAHDYPVLYWLSRLIAPGGRLVDLGGATGVTYRLFKSRLQLPADFQWQVNELPEVIEYAHRVIAGESVPHLSFTDDWRAIDGAAIVLSAGAVQFFPQPLSKMLADVHERPTDILINRVPVTENGSSFFTLQNTGRSIAPMRVESRSAFIADLASLDYELVDEWKCLENSLEIPFHHECDLAYFRGYCFHLRQPGRVGASAAAAPAQPTATRSANRVVEKRPRRHPVLHPTGRAREAAQRSANGSGRAVGESVARPTGRVARQETWPACRVSGRTRRSRAVTPAS